MAIKLVKKNQSEVFGTSFLDIISCGFGAMLVLLILAKDSEEEIPSPDFISEYAQDFCNFPKGPSINDVIPKNRFPPG